MIPYRHSLPTLVKAPIDNLDNFLLPCTITLALLPSIFKVSLLDVVELFLASSSAISLPSMKMKKL